MTRRHMEIFIAVVEHGKMSEAAKALYITQSSVSQAIAEIEREYGVLLFERLSRSLYLTDIGRNFLAYARQILRLQADMEQYLQTSSRSQNIRIGATITVGTCVISPLISRLKKEFPDICPEIFIANTHILEDRLLKCELDVGLVEGRVVSTDLVEERAIQDSMVMICSLRHPFCGRSSVKIQELANQPMILRESGSGTRAQLETQMRELRIPLKTIWDCYNTEAIINGVMDGHGISVISKRLVADHVRRGKLWMCDVEGINLERSFNLVLHKDKFLTPALIRFTDLCREYGLREFPDDSAR